jgi:hypothetical protein
MEPAVPIEEQLNLDFELGTGHKRAGYPSNLLITAIFKITNQKSSGRFVMPSRNESERARVRLQLETPVADENLLKLQEQVADYVREAKRRDPSEPDELVSRAIKAVALDYFRIQKQRRRVREFQVRHLVRHVATRNP